MTGPIDIAAIVRGLAERTPELAHELFPNGRREGAEWFIGSLAGEPGKSMAIHLSGTKAGVWCDFATGEAGDALDLVAWALFGGDKKQAVRWSKGWLGLDGSDPSRLRTRRPAVIPKDPEREARKEVEKKRKAAFALWLEAQKEILNTPADRYLQGRAIHLARLDRVPRALRFHRGLRNPENDVLYPAMLAAITGPDGQVWGVHRTWLRELGDGRVVKAPLEDPRRTLGPYRGGAIRIWRGAGHRPLAQAVENSTAVLTEGIEDALCVALDRPDLRVLAAVSLSAMAHVVLPEAIGDVVIFADNDEGKQAKAGLERAVTAFYAQGRQVRVARSDVGKDANDLWRAQQQRERDGAA